MSRSAPSIGAIGEIAEDPFNDRSKGWLPLVVDTRDDLLALLTRVARRVEFGTRIQIRTFLGPQVADPGNLESRSWRFAPFQLEALIPVVGHPAVAHIAYYGACFNGRLPPAESVLAQRELLERVQAMERRPISVDLKIERLSQAPSEEDIQELVQLYRSRYTTYLTEFTPESVRRMVAGNVVMVVRDELGMIASVAVGEMVTIALEGGPLVLVEISDAATRRDRESRGYYTAAKAALIRCLREEGPCVITTEARANSAGVLRSNLNLGMQLAGYEPAHCVISARTDEDVPQTSRFGDLHVFYVP